MSENDDALPAICPNCGSDFQGAYCSSCGQKDEPIRQSTFYFLRESFGELFGLDGRVWQTLSLLVTKPGALTLAYIEGKRRQYIRPLRLYLTATVLFFSLITIFDPVGKAQRLRDDISAKNVTVTVRERLLTLDDAIGQEEASVAKRQIEQERLTRMLDSLSVNPQTKTDSVAIANALRQVTRQQKSIDKARASLALKERQFDWERSVLETFPTDSVIAPVDLATASRYVFPGLETGTVDFRVGLPDWAVRNESIQRMEKAENLDEFLNELFVFARGVVGRIPAAMFVLLPVFALILKLLYVRNSSAASVTARVEEQTRQGASQAVSLPAMSLPAMSLPTMSSPAMSSSATVSPAEPARTAKSKVERPVWYYTEHLVFGLHTHAFTFVVLFTIALVIGIWGWSPATQVICAILNLWVMGYFVFALKRVYNQGWLKTLMKTFLIGISYLFVLVVLGLILTLLLAAVLG